MKPMFDPAVVDSEQFCDTFMTPIAKACHAAVGNFHMLLGQEGFMPWFETDVGVQDAWIEIVKTLVLDNEATDEALHDAWVKFKVAQGWTLGQKDTEAKTHPELRPLAETPTEFQYRYRICRDVFYALTVGWADFANKTA